MNHVIQILIKLALNKIGYLIFSWDRLGFGTQPVFLVQRSTACNSENLVGTNPVLNFYICAYTVTIARLLPLCEHKQQSSPLMNNFNTYHSKICNLHLYFWCLLQIENLYVGIRWLSGGTMPYLFTYVFISLEKLVKVTIWHD